MSKVVIADTSCLISLSNIELLDILRNLYQEIVITKEVHTEFGESLPEWIQVWETKNKEKQQKLETHIDKGEASSIATAIEQKNSVLIIDEIKGRRIAKSYDLNIIGTVGVILLAHKNGYIEDVIPVILKLVNNGFRLSNELLDKIIESYRK